MVWRLDRLGRSLKHLIHRVEKLGQQGIVKRPPIFRQVVKLGYPDEDPEMKGTELLISGLGWPLRRSKVSSTPMIIG